MSVIELLDIGWRAVSFQLVQPRNVARMDGRRTEAQTFGTPFWTATYEARYLTKEQFGLFDAFMMQAGDGSDVFLGYDVFRPRPVMEDDGTPLSFSSADLTARTDNSISVSGLPSGFRLSPGDYVEIRMSEMVRSLHRIIAPETASGGSATLQIMPVLDTETFTTAATVHFEKPACTMQINAEGRSARKSWEERRPTFSATEVFFS